MGGAGGVSAGGRRAIEALSSKSASSGRRKPGERETRMSRVGGERGGARRNEVDDERTTRAAAAQRLGMTSGGEGVKRRRGGVESARRNSAEAGKRGTGEQKTIEAGEGMRSERGDRAKLACRHQRGNTRLSPG